MTCKVPIYRTINWFVLVHRKMYTLHAHRCLETESEIAEYGF